MLDRRAFLMGTAAAVAWGSQLAGNEAQSELRLGFSTYGMKTMSVLDALATLHEIGYRSVELALMPGWPSEPKLLDKSQRKTIRQYLRAHDMALDGLMLNIRPTTDANAAAEPIRELRDGAELGRDLTGGACPPIETVLGGRPDQWEQLKGELVQGLKPWAKAAEDDDFVIAIKPHVSGAMSTPERAIWLRDQVGSDKIQLAYDYSHFGLQDLPLEPAMQTMLPHTVFVHIKDYVKTNNGFRFVLPGETDFDYASYLQLLKKHGYSGTVCVEVSGQVWNKKDYDPIAAAKFCYSKLSPAFQ